MIQALLVLSRARRWLVYGTWLTTMAACLAGCGGGGGGTQPPPDIQVAISPSTNSLVVGATQQFTASVSGSSNQSVTWSVNGVTGGNRAAGAISSSGLYTAPPNVPNPAMVIITATSVANPSSSANLNLTIKLRISVTPPTPTVQLFHSLQFTASVSGVAQTGVQWFVNGVAGGNSTFGVIDATGLYAAPISLPPSSPIVIQATSVVDPSQSATSQASIVPDTTAPQVVAITPADQATGVNLQPTIQVTFNEKMDPSSFTSTSLTFLQGKTAIPVSIGYDLTKNLLSLSPQQLLTPSTSYTLSIAGAVRDLGGNPMNSPFSAVFSTTGGASVPSTVSSPPGVDPTTLTIVSLSGQNTTPAPDGSFSASVRTQGTTAVAAVVPGESFGLFAVSISNANSADSSVAQSSRTTLRIVGGKVIYSSQWQITASPTLAQNSQSMVLDFQTTAESLLFLSPALFHSDSVKAAQIMTAIAAEPKTTQVAAALQAVWNTPFPLRDQGFVNAYQAALSAIVTTLAQGTPEASAANAHVPVTGSSASANTTSLPSTAPVYHPFDVCCLQVGSFDLEGANYVAPISVNGPTLQHLGGNASGWLVRVVQLPANLDPTTIVPGTDAKGNVDSPPKIGQEDQDVVLQTLWIPGSSIFKYSDLLGQLNDLLANVLNSLAGFSSADATTLILPQPTGSSSSSLIRAYSGGDGDLSELDLIATLPDGENLWIRARLANYTTVIFDEIGALGVVPSGMMNCLTQSAIQDEVMSALVDPSSSSFIGGTDAWSGFVNANAAVLGDFKNHFFGCAVAGGIDTVLGILADLAKFASVIGDILQGASTISSAGEAIQIVTEMEGTDSPVDTAYITLNNFSSAPVASIKISPANPTLGAGSQQRFSYIARDAQGNTIPNVFVAWTPSDTSIATIDSTGMATGVAPGQASISVTAPSSGASDTTILTVTSQVLDHLTLAPVSATLHIGQMAQFSVLGVSNTGNPIALGPVSWTVSAPAVVSVNSTGLVTALEAGSSFINADSGGKSVAGTISVIGATPSQIVINPANATINVGNSLLLTATAIDSVGNPITGVAFSWSLNSPPGVVTVDSNGTIHAVAAGQATVTASAGGLSGLASITVLVAGSQLSLGGNASCTNSSPQVHLQWNNINASSYDVYRENVLLQPNIMATNLTDEVNLVAGTTYDYFLKAHLLAGGTATSNIASVAVPATCPGASGTIKIFPTTFNPTFTVGDAPATLGFQISNGGSGTLTGTITANPTGGAWLTVDGHTSTNWVAPAGVSVTATPTGLSPGSYTGNLTVSSPGATNSPIVIPVQMTIYAPLQIGPSTLPTAFSGKTYSVTLTATGGSGSGLVWSLQDGTLPLGLTLNSATGVISGTPGSITGTATRNINIGLQDSAGHFTYKSFALVWQQSLVILPISPSNFEFVVGTPYTTGNSITFQAAGGTPPYGWSGTGLPPGLSVVAGSGLVNGTPTQPGTFQANITVTDNNNLSATAVIPLTVLLTSLKVTGPSGESPPNLPAGKVGVAYNETLSATGGSQSGYTWNVQGTLPPGLSATNSPGCPAACGLQIAGTPSQAGVFTFVAIVTDSLKDTTQQNVTIAINSGNPPQITTATLPLATIGQTYSSSLSATGGTPPYVWSIAGSGLDPALQLSASGTISGTPGVANDCPTGPGLWINIAPPIFFQVQVKDAAGQARVRELCLPSYFPDPQISSLSPPNVIVDGQTHTMTVKGQNFRNNGFISIAGSGGTTFVNSNAISFTLIPSNGGAFAVGSSGGIINEGSTSFTIIQPYTNDSNQGSVVVFDPAPTVSSVSAVANNSTTPCTTRLTCQLVINGSGLVFVTAYQIVETNTTLIRAANPSTSIPWDTVTTSAFSITTPGIYTVTVTNPNQPNGGSATAKAQFTVNP